MVARTLLAALLTAALSACASGPRGAAEPRALPEMQSPFAALLPWNPTRRDVQSTPDGVQYVAIRRGDPAGKHPMATDQVEVQYDARLAADGKLVDRTPEGQITRFRLADVVPGLSAGIQKMVPGDQFMFFVPARLAYGARAIGPVPANADLVFLTTLSGVASPRTADLAAWARVRPWPTEGAKRTASGVEYIVLSSGGGAPPALRDHAVVHYEGRLDDGSIFDSSFAGGQPAYFQISQLIPGLAEALLLMQPGDHWMVRVPPALAYGAAGARGVPPNAVLTFEVELESVLKTP